MIYSKKNRGLAQSNNLGAKYSKSDYLLFLNVDTEVKKNCLREIVKKFDADQNIGIIQIKLIKKNKTIDTVGHYMSVTGFPYDIAQGQNPRKFAKEMIVFGAKNAGLAMRKKLFFDVGAFDQNYVIYGEDTDLCWRSWLAGYKTIYLPTAISYHYEGSSITKKTSFRIFYEGAKNNLNYILKDAPVPLVFLMAPLHVLLWLLLSIRLVFERRAHLSVWILRGLMWNVIHLRSTLAKRKEVRAFARQTPTGAVMYGQMSFKHLFSKGVRWITSI